ARRHDWARVIMLLRLAVVIAPWWLKRHLLRLLYGYQLHPTSRIGLAWIFPRRLVMDRGARIGHLSVCKGVDLLELREQASIGRLNWITAYPRGDAPHFQHLTERKPQLLLAEHAAITHRHIIDCTEQVSIGSFSTLAGFRTQILTHSIDLVQSRQDARPV